MHNHLSCTRASSVRGSQLAAPSSESRFWTPVSASAPPLHPLLSRHPRFPCRCAAFLRSLRGAGPPSRLPRRAATTGFERTPLERRLQSLSRSRSPRDKTHRQPLFAQGRGVFSLRPDCPAGRATHGSCPWPRGPRCSGGSDPGQAHQAVQAPGPGGHARRQGTDGPTASEGGSSHLEAARASPLGHSPRPNSGRGRRLCVSETRVCNQSASSTHLQAVVRIKSFRREGLRVAPDSQRYW